LEMIEGCCEPCCDALKSCFRSIGSIFGFQQKNRKASTVDNGKTTQAKHRWLSRFSPKQQRKVVKKRLKKNKKGLKPSASPIVSEPLINSTENCLSMSTDNNKSVADQQKTDGNIAAIQRKEELQSLKPTPEPSAGIKREAIKATPNLTSLNLSPQKESLFTTPYSSITSASSYSTSEELSSESTFVTPHYVNFIYPTRKCSKTDQFLYTEMKNFDNSLLSNFKKDYLPKQASNMTANDILIDPLDHMADDTKTNSASDILKSVVHSFFMSESTDTSNEDLD